MGSMIDVMKRMREQGSPPRTNVLQVTLGPDGRTPVVSGAVEPFVEHARAAGLLVHPYTLRAEEVFLFSYQGRPLTIAEEAAMLLDAGADGFFIDQPSEGRLAVDGRLPKRHR